MMASPVHDQVAAAEQGGSGGPRSGGPGCLATAGADAGEATEAGEASEGGWQAPMALLALVALLALGGAVADAVAGVGGELRPSATRPVAGSGPAPSALVAGPPGSVHVVQPGETFWSIAQVQGGQGDIRGRVDALREAHGGRPLAAGDRLVLPDLE